MKALLSRYTITLLIFMQLQVSANAQATRVDNTPVSTVSATGNDYLSLNGKLYIPSRYEYFGMVDSPYSAIWESDGTPAGTYPMSYVNGASQLTRLSANKFCFVTTASPFGIPLPLVLNISDGTDAGTMKLMNFSTTGVLEYVFVNIFNSIDGKVFFFVNRPNIRAELWVTDGTVSGTEKLKDFQEYVYADLYKGDKKWSISHNNEVYFTAIDSTSSSPTLWKSDGTVAGTVSLANANGEPTLPQGFVEFSGEVFFSADSNTEGLEMWKTDGTLGGTTLFKDIYPGSSNNSDPKNFTVMGSKLFFSANNGADGNELWVSDGTVANTAMLKNIAPNPWANSDPTAFKVFNGKLYFFANDGVHGLELWKSDGTAAGTDFVKDIKPGTSGQYGNGKYINMATNSDYLFFTADDGTHGVEIWKTDGITANTTLLKDIAPGTASGIYSNVSIFGSEYGKLYTYGNQVFFTANDGQTGFEPWVTDGESIELLRDTNPGSGFIEGAIVSDIFPSLGAVNNGDQWFADDDFILFTAHDTLYGQEPYISNGSSSPVLLKDIHSGSEGSTPGQYTSFNGQFFFSGDDGTGNQLWVSDGTTAGTQTIGTDLAPFSFTEYSGKLYFGGKEGLYSTDGTAPGTVLVFTGDLYKDAKPEVMNGLLYFSANDGSNGVELWVTDGDSTLSALHTHMVKDIMSGSGSSNPYNLWAFDNLLYFSALDGIHGRELWKSDGTVAGTEMIANLNQDPDPYNASGPDLGSSPYGFTPFNGDLYFAAYDGEGVSGIFGSFHLFKTDGISISLVKRLNNDTDPAPAGFTVYNSKLYFSAKDLTHGYELWASDGTAAGTSIIHEFLPGPGSSTPFGLIVYDNKLYFSAVDMTHGYETRYLDTFGDFHLLADIKTGPAGSLSMPMVKKGNALFMWASDNTDQVALYRVGGDCPDTLSPSGITVNNQKAGISVSTLPGNTVSSGATVTYQGGAYVSLNPGFKAETGSVFVSKILGGCQ